MADGTQYGVIMNAEWDTRARSTDSIESTVAVNGRNRISLESRRLM